MKNQCMHKKERCHRFLAKRQKKFASYCVKNLSVPQCSAVIVLKKSMFLGLYC